MKSQKSWQRDRLRLWRDQPRDRRVKRKRILIVVGFFNPSILSGFTRYAREADWVVNVISVFHQAVPGDWEADGMLTTNVFRQDLAKFIRKYAQKIPTVLHGCDDMKLGVSNVECDEHEVGKMAAHHLIDQEHRHFAFFRYSNNIHAMKRRAGFQECLKEFGHDYIDLEMISEHGEGIEKWFKGKLSRLPKPLGLFAEDDLLAAQAIEAAMDAGWKVPEELAVVGCGNMEMVCELGSVPITSISCPIEEQAYQAAALLDARMRAKKKSAATIGVVADSFDCSRKHQCGGSALGACEAGLGLHERAIGRSQSRCAKSCRAMWGVDTFALSGIRQRHAQYSDGVLVKNEIASCQRIARED